MIFDILTFISHSFWDNWTSRNFQSIKNKFTDENYSLVNVFLSKYSIATFLDEVTKPM